MRYTEEQLQEMARPALDDNALGGYRYLQLVMTLCMMTGLSANEVEERIRALA